jgi:protein SCO1/2
MFPPIACYVTKCFNWYADFFRANLKPAIVNLNSLKGCKFAKIIFMTKRNKRILIYVGFFVVLLGVFYLLLFNDYDFSRSTLQVRNDNVADFSFINQDGKKITEREVEGKVYVVEYFFTTCKGICPKMNANMRRVFDAFKDEPNFMIISHTCMPETDSVPLLKAYEEKMIEGKLEKNADGSYKIVYDTASKTLTPKPLNLNWNFVTGDKTLLYKMARQDYGIDNGKPDTTQLMKDQFIHTQFFALVDKQRRVRGMVYDGLNNDEVEKLITDIKGLLKEKVTTKHFMNGFSSDPN